MQNWLNSLDICYKLRVFSIQSHRSHEIFLSDIQWIENNKMPGAAFYLFMYRNDVFYFILAIQSERDKKNTRRRIQ